MRKSFCRTVTFQRDRTEHWTHFMACHVWGYIRLVHYKDIHNKLYYMENNVSYVIKWTCIQCLWKLRKTMSNYMLHVLPLSAKTKLFTKPKMLYPQCLIILLKFNFAKNWFSQYIVFFFLCKTITEKRDLKC